MTSSDTNNFFGYGAGRSLTGSCSDNLILGSWFGPSATQNHAIVISGGVDNYVPALDCGFTTPGWYNGGSTWTWSFTTRRGTLASPCGVHIYNLMDASPPTNYERACLDWNLTSNVFRIASQAGAGGSVVRLIAIDGFQKAGAPAAGDLPSGTFALINDTSGGNTWLVYNAAGTIRKVQLT
jgi:hypothetical protein